MKSHILSKAFALLALAAAPALADSSPMYEAPLTDDDQLSLACVDVDFGYMTDFDDGLSVDALYGVTLGTSYTFDATTEDYHKLTFSIGMYYGTDSFSYPGTEIDHSFTNPGKQKNTQRIFPVMIGYSYHRQICSDLSFYVGGQVGVYISNSDQKFDEGRRGNIVGENGRFYHSKVSPTVGVGIGVEYNIADNWKWNIGAQFNFSHSMLDEGCRTDRYIYGYEVSEGDVTTTTIHTGFSYSF